jgi:hypothetical protein
VDKQVNDRLRVGKDVDPLVATVFCTHKPPENFDSLTLLAVAEWCEAHPAPALGSYQEARAGAVAAEASERLKAPKQQPSK